jgi:uncharacterized membrane protein
MKHFAILIVRYAAAIAVACIVSFIIADLFRFIFTPAVWDDYFSNFFQSLVVGFCGVFSGTWCLPRTNRRSGSLILLVFGLAFYAQILLRLNMCRAEDGDNPFFPCGWLLHLAAGGFVAVYFFRRQPADKSPNSTTGAAGSSASLTTL